MGRKTIIDLQLEILKKWRKYYENIDYYLQKIKKIAKEYDSSAKVILFGSIVEGTSRPGSDIDVLIITDLAKNVEDRIELRMKIAEQIGDITPFEFHIITREEYEGWYKRFINKYREI